LARSIWDLPKPKYNPITGEPYGKVRNPVGSGKKTDALIRAKGKCQKCGKSLEGLRPHIHHKNGNPSDNRSSNLIVLCPNCHSTMHVYRTKTEYHPIYGATKKTVLVTKRIKTRGRKKKSRKKKRKTQTDIFGFPVSKRKSWF